MEIRRFSLILFLLLFVLSCSGKQAARPSERFDPEKAFAIANEALEKKEYDKARASFLEVKNRDLIQEVCSAGTTENCGFLCKRRRA